ncbi:cupin domain-containing protein [Halorientalis marina]|jgi:mannose-6-phosphate isomerase-like protein (cupin superfamily)|uniref:cupin domain-containing protein n=1 Tax=Halorientalis marina TaxID=2931976 RepID=UPI001FF38722|nr:cupin domain-containing protein [Halorientalis marina]
MEHVDIDALDNHPRVADVQKHLTDPLALADMALNYYELEPGESFSGGLHTHMNQEEVFYVVEGTATFDTKEGSHEVGANEVIRFAPGEYQEGKNESDGRVRALAFGAPQEAGETRTALPCSECGADYHTAEVTADGVTLTCPDCGNVVEM